jgi:hypothetical protein
LVFLKLFVAFGLEHWGSWYGEWYSIFLEANSEAR